MQFYILLLIYKLYTHSKSVYQEASNIIFFLNNLYTSFFKSLLL